MTKRERIEELERKVQDLELEIALTKTHPSPPYQGSICSLCGATYVGSHSCWQWNPATLPYLWPNTTVWCHS